MPLPATKLRPPRAPPTPVPRPRLDLVLDEARRSARVTMIVAPAGYGKTTLVAEWIARSPTRAAWFALDPGDDPSDDPSDRLEADARLSDWLAASLVEARALVAPPSVRGTHALAAALEATSWRGVVVLDDAHHLRPPGAAALATWVERAPEGVHTVAIARWAPPAGIARWLARGDAVLVQADVLRMDAAEGRALLATAAPELSIELADALTARVEGWAAGLHLAARSLRGRADPGDVIERFTGTDRYVLAFLTEEVLLRLPDDLHEAALLLAGEPRLCAGLVTALTGRPDGGAVLAALEEREAFLERLDDARDPDGPWFRFTGFFRDLLAHRLRLARPDLAARQRARSARWWAERRVRAATDAPRAAGGASAPPAPAADALTEREQEVLALLSSGASTKSIARTMGVSPNTVKTHLRHVFEKLGVGGRTAAAARARELGLV